MGFNLLLKLVRIINVVVAALDVDGTEEEEGEIEIHLRKFISKKIKGRFLSGHA